MSKRHRDPRRIGPGRVGTGRYGRLHRSLGLITVAFIVFLSVTGIALNHSTDLGLDRRYIGADWLLDRYGIDAPEVGPSFALGERRLTLVGERLFLDDREVARDIGVLAGGARFRNQIVAGSDDALLFISPAGELLDRVPLGAGLDGPIRGPAISAGTLVLALGSELRAYDERSFALVPFGGETQGLDWPRASPVPVPLLDRIELAYRGRGLTFERLLYDLHSGRILARAGTWVMDFVGGLLLVLAGTGLYLWFRR